MLPTRKGTQGTLSKRRWRAILILSVLMCSLTTRLSLRLVIQALGCNKGTFMTYDGTIHKLPSSLLVELLRSVFLFNLFINFAARTPGFEQAFNRNRGLDRDDPWMSDLDWVGPCGYRRDSRRRWRECDSLLSLLRHHGNLSGVLQRSLRSNTPQWHQEGIIGKLSAL